MIRLDIQFELPPDLQRVLDDDLVLLQQQIESVHLEQLHNELKTVCERIEKQQPIHRALAIPFFAGPNAPSDSEIIKPVLDSTLRILKAYAPRILSVEVDRLLQEVRELFVKAESLITFHCRLLIKRSKYIHIQQISLHQRYLITTIVCNMSCLISQPIVSELSTDSVQCMI